MSCGSARAEACNRREDFIRSGEVTRVKGRGILGIAMTPPRKPLIAAVEGYALAGATTSPRSHCAPMAGTSSTG